MAMLNCRGLLYDMVYTYMHLMCWEHLLDVIVYSSILGTNLGDQTPFTHKAGDSLTNCFTLLPPAL